MALYFSGLFHTRWIGAVVGSKSYSCYLHNQNYGDHAFYRYIYMASHLPASDIHVYSSRLLITFSNSLDPDQESDLKLIQIV